MCRHRQYRPAQSAQGRRIIKIKQRVSPISNCTRIYYHFHKHFDLMYVFYDIFNP